MMQRPDALGWLGMAGPPMRPDAALKRRVLAHALRPRPAFAWGWGVAAAAAIGLVLGGSHVWRQNARLRAELAALEAQARSVEDTLSLLRAPATRATHAAFRTDGRVGAMTAFVDSTTRRLLIVCHNLAPNAPGETYQVWFVTAEGPVSGGLMPMHTSQPMMMTLTLPERVAPVTALALSVEPEQGSVLPRGPILVRLDL